MGLWRVVSLLALAVFLLAGCAGSMAGGDTERPRLRTASEEPTAPPADTDGRNESVSREGEPNPTEDPYSGEPGDCSALANDKMPESYFRFLADVSGCVVLEGGPLPPPLNILNASVLDPETGESLGLVKDLDPDLSVGDVRTDNAGICAVFPLYDGLTAQGYFEGMMGSLSEANARERAILDPDRDGVACSEAAAQETNSGDPRGEFIFEYYRAVGSGDWATTYSMLDDESKNVYTEDEWSALQDARQSESPLPPVISARATATTDNGDGTLAAEVILNESQPDEATSNLTLSTDGERYYRHLTPEDLAFLDALNPSVGGGNPSDGAGVCAGVSGCEVVDTADVDGDGVLDEIAIVGEPDEYSGGQTWISVRVLLADGTTLERDSEIEFWNLPVYHGATDFGQVAGEEIVIGAMTGAHTLSYRVLTYRDGELVELPHPKDISYEGSFIWSIDAAASISMGIECDPTDSTVVLRSVTSVGPPGDGVPFEGEETRWVLEGDVWRLVDSTPLFYPDASSTFGIPGWSCGDLPRMHK